MSETSTLIAYAGRTLPREELALVPTPAATTTHQPVPHHEIVQVLVETLGFRHIGVVNDEYAVSPDGMKMFGVLDLETEMHGARFSIGLRNSHDKTTRQAGVLFAELKTASYDLFRWTILTEEIARVSEMRRSKARAASGLPRWTLDGLLRRAAQLWRTFETPVFG